MDLSESVDTLVRARSSHRKFRAEVIVTAHRERLEQEMAALEVPFGSPMRFELLAATPDDPTALRGLHTYGFIKNPAAFIVGAFAPSPRGLEDYGYALEQLVLLATDLGIGSCWLGGTFNKSRFSDKIGLASDETLPAVVALGYPTKTRGNVEELIRWGAGSKNRRPWSEKFFDRSFSRALPEDPQAWWTEPLELVRLAPSASNKQPAVVVVDVDAGPRFHFYLRRTSGYARNNGLLGIADLQRVDLGIAMCHFELGVDNAGHHGSWLVDEPELSEVGPLPEGTQYVCTWMADSA